jgi:hypothetical protein
VRGELPWIRSGTAASSPALDRDLANHANRPQSSPWSLRLDRGLTFGANRASIDVWTASRHGHARSARPATRWVPAAGSGSSSRRRRIAVAKDDQAPPSRRPRSPGSDRLTSSVEIVRVRGPDAAHLAEVQLEAIKEVLTWALSQHRTSRPDEDRAA